MVGIQRIPRDPMNCMVLGTHLGVLLCPKTCFSFPCFCWDFKFSAKIAGGPCGVPIVPCGSLGCLLPLGEDLRVSKKAPLLAHLGFRNLVRH